jgi:nitroreductase
LALTKWAGALRDRHFPPEGHEPTAFVVICTKEDIFTRDVGIAAQTIMLSAVEVGLGGCMIGSFDEEKLRELLGIPLELRPRLILALGRPDETVVLEDAEENNLTYYRDEMDVHHVPKLKTEDMIL